MLQFRASIIQKLRNFFINKNYLELDTPALSPTLIPENCLEVFSTDYIEPWANKRKTLYLVPSPEIFIKKIIAKYKTDVFQLSKCYRNVESVGNIHSPEFTMLEYYTMNADYRDSMEITEKMIESLLPPLSANEADDPLHFFRPPFTRLTMDEAFKKYAGFSLDECTHQKDLVNHARKLGITEFDNNPFTKWGWDDLYELILVQCVEPGLKNEPKATFLIDYPVKVPCLAKTNGLHKERWELYCCGVELANCYSEETDSKEIKEYFKNEGKIKNKTAIVPHAIDDEYYKTFEDFPKCSGVAMGVDRLIMLLAGQKSIESIIPFPFRLKTGYY